MIRRALPWLLWVWVAVQGTLFARASWSEVRSARERARLLRADEPPPIPPHAPLAAARDLPRVAEAIPKDARVLVLDTGLAPIAFAFYLRPRPVRSLLDLSREDLELVPECAAWNKAEALRHFDRLDAAGAVRTPERLARELERADFVVAFPLETEVDVEGVRLEPVLREGWASLLRVAREEEP